MTLLKIYALYKQATRRRGGKRPGFSDMVGRAKWDAWNERQGQEQRRGDAGVRRPDRIAEVARSPGLGACGVFFGGGLLAPPCARWPCRAARRGSSRSRPRSSWLNAPSRKPSLAFRSKWSAATISWPLTPARVNSTVSLVSPSSTVHSMSNFFSTSSAHFQATLRALARPERVLAVDAGCRASAAVSLSVQGARSVAWRSAFGKAARRLTSA